MDFALSALSHAKEFGRPGKLAHAAQDFEAILLKTALGPLEESFRSLPGQTPSATSTSYSDLGIQVLANQLAAQGGLGIAGRILANLLKQKE
jgi:Rod binding domain-containing protein